MTTNSTSERPRFGSDTNPLDLPGYLLDIYTLRRSVPDPPVEGMRLVAFEPDTTNLIILSREEAATRGMPLFKREIQRGPACLGLGVVETEELACGHCGRATLFIRRIGINWLCPSCALEELESQGELRPTCCGLPLGCDSCGGIVKPMIEIQRQGRYPLLVCSRDQCLMPFGYRVPNPFLVCTCEVDMARIIDSKIGRDLGGIVRGYLIMKRNYWGTRRAVVLGDLSVTMPDRCLPCQIERDYKSWALTGDRVTGPDRVCRCSNSLLTGSSSLLGSNAGKASLLTPVSTPNCRRTQSSGERSDTYTPSTSEI